MILQIDEKNLNFGVLSPNFILKGLCIQKIVTT